MQKIKNYMPFHMPKSLRKADKFAVIFIVIPAIISGIYFGLLASDVYVSESRFVVRSPEKPTASPLGLALAGAGFTTGGQEAFSTKSYLESRAALSAINTKGTFKAAYTRPSISVFDRFAPFGKSGSFEQLYKYYSNKIKVDYDATTSISTLTVRAYTPEDAASINENLLQVAEGTIDRLNQRGRNDMIRFASAEVKEAEDRVRRSSVALAAFRNKEGVVDPEMQATAQLGMISKLQDEQILSRAQLNQLMEFAPANPQIPVLQNRLQTLRDAIREQMLSLTGNDRSLAATAVQYEKLVLEKEFADKQLTGALASLQEARNDSLRQQIYVERIAQPNHPDTPLEPRRLRGFLATLALGLVAWGIASMLAAGVREHAQ